MACTSRGNLGTALADCASENFHRTLSEVEVMTVVNLVWLGLGPVLGTVAIETDALHTNPWKIKTAITEFQSRANFFHHHRLPH
jgi:hypothetical protein